MRKRKPEKQTVRQISKANTESIDNLWNRYMSSPVGSKEAADTLAAFRSRQGESEQEPESSDEDDE